MLKRFIRVGSSFIFVILVAVAVYFALGILTQPSAKPGFPVSVKSSGGPVVGNYTGIREEQQYLCGDVHIIFQGRAPKELVGMDMDSLREKYPRDDGWEIQWDKNGSITLRRETDEFCPEHSGYRHLGVYQDYLAVYQGPIGYNQKLIRVEGNIPVRSLPAAQQVKLRQVMDYHSQAPETQGQLKAEFEFKNVSELNAVLENLDEIGGE